MISRFRPRVIQAGIENVLGGIQTNEFTTAAGDRANQKVELDVLSQQNRASKLIRQMVISEFVSMLEPLEFDLLVTIPTGADHLGEGVSKRLYKPNAYLHWVDKAPGSKKVEARTSHDKELIKKAGRIALLDDVFSTGSSLMAAYGMEEIGDKIVTADVVWDRSDGSLRKDMPFPVESIIHEYVPLWVSR